MSSRFIYTPVIAVALYLSQKCTQLHFGTYSCEIPISITSKVQNESGYIYEEEKCKLVQLKRTKTVFTFFVFTTVVETEKILTELLH